MLNSNCSLPETPFSPHVQLGLLVVWEASMLSAISVLVVLCYTVYRVSKKIIYAPPHQRLKYLGATDSLAFVLLLLGEFIKSLGGAVSLKWVLRAQIEDLDPLCQAQGYLRQVGDNSVALFSLLIGFDTFFVLTYGWRANKYVNIGALAAVCLFIVLLAIVPGMGVSHKGPPYMGTTGYWCWITSSYLAYQISLEYLWMWIAALVQLILYGLIALVMRRCLVVDSESKYRLRLRTRDGTSSTIDSSRSDELGKERKENEMIANLMLFYPAIYIICVLPLSIARWKQFIQCAQSPAAIIVTNCIFELSGLLTVLLYTFTRPALVSGRNLDQTRSANGLEDESDHKVSEHDNKDPSSCVIVSEVLDPKAPGNGEGSSTSGRVRPVSSSAR